MAYCRMEICLRGIGDVADEFLHAYETATGKPVANLAFWELAAAARPMFSPEGWITASPAKEAFRSFIDDATRRASGRSFDASGKDRFYARHPDE